MYTIMFYHLLDEIHKYSPVPLVLLNLCKARWKTRLHQDSLLMNVRFCGFPAACPVLYEFVIYLLVCGLEVLKTCVWCTTYSHKHLFRHRQSPEQCLLRWVRETKTLKKWTQTVNVQLCMLLWSVSLWEISPTSVISWCR